ncbi:hypothetical protein MNEG_9331, partial [Monoraphidium neglectum]
MARPGALVALVAALSCGLVSGMNPSAGEVGTLSGAAVTRPAAKAAAPDTAARLAGTPGTAPPLQWELQPPVQEQQLQQQQQQQQQQLQQQRQQQHLQQQGHQQWAQLQQPSAPQQVADVAALPGGSDAPAPAAAVPAPARGPSSPHKALWPLSHADVLMFALAAGTL